MSIGIIFGLYFLFTKYKRGITSIISVMVLITLVSGYYAGNLPEVTDLGDELLILGTGLILFFMSYGFRDFSTVKYISTSPRMLLRLRQSLRILKPLLFVVLVINVLILFDSFSLLLNESILVDEFKNEDGFSQYRTKSELFDTLVSISNWCSPLGFIMLVLHFYFLGKGQLKESVVMLLLALNLPMNGLHALSRAAVTQFILLYIAFFFVTYNTVPRNLIRKVNIAGLLILALILSTLVFITLSRFNEDRYMSFSDKARVENIAIYSALDYLSQWHGNSLVTIKQFDQDKVWYGQSSAPIIFRIASSVGFEVEKYSEVRQISLGEQWSKFNGLISTLLYDFGYIFFPLIILVYYSVVRLLKPVNGIFEFTKLFYFGLLCTPLLLFFTNNSLSNISSNMAVFYCVLYVFYLKRF